MYSLWRGAECLGEIAPEFPQEREADDAENDCDAFAGMLQLRAGGPPPVALIQTTFGGVIDGPVLHQVFPDGELGSLARGVETAASRPLAALRTLAVPEASRLSVRDADGHRVSTWSIVVDRRDPSGSRDLLALCAEANVPMSDWFVFVTRMKETPRAP